MPSLVFSKEAGLELHRRRLLACMAAAGPSLALGSVFGAAPAGAQTSSSLIDHARQSLARYGHKAINQQVVGLVDFAQPSSQARLHLVDLSRSQVTSLLVAHGRGSDPEHSGWVRRFSNDFGSFASCEGAFLTGAYYTGKHGRSMRLNGLEPTNSNAEAREIVVHAAPYVGPGILRQTGKLGRSEGCFALDVADLSVVLDRLGPGHLLVAGKLV